MTPGTSNDAPKGARSLCLTELSVTTLVAYALGVSAVLWLLIFAVI